jgi:hypothetical protein
MQDLKKPITVIDFSPSSKQAALYFDRVVPMLLGQVDVLDFPFYKETGRSILPEALCNDDDDDPFVSILSGSIAYDPHKDDPRTPSQREEHRKEFDNLLKRANVTDAPFLFPHGNVCEEVGDVNAKTRLQLSGMQLIDVSGVSWEQIVEFRKSREAVTKLRRLIHAFQTDYQNRDSEFIKDDILIRIEDYNSVVKVYCSP